MITIELDIDRTKDLFNYFVKLKYELDIKNLILNLRRSDKIIA